MTIANASEAAGHEPIRVGPWLIDAMTRQVIGPNGSTRVEPKAMGVLLELAARPGQVVDRQRILERVWGPEMATDDVLSRAISELRRALGDDSRNPRFILTVRGAGYRLEVPAPPLSSPLASRPAVAPAIAPAIAPPATAPTPRPHRRASLILGAVTAGAALASLLMVLALRSPDPDRATAVGVSVEPLTARPGLESAPSLSRDGTRIAYGWRADPRAAQQIYVRLVDRESEVQVTRDGGNYQLSAWSADGSQLAVTRTDSGALGIYVVPSLGGSDRLIMRVGGPFLPGLDWSRDGARLAYAALDSGTMSFGIRVHELESARESRLTSGAPDAFGDVYSTFSPDGRLVAFVRFFTEVAADVYVVPAAGGRPTRLTTDERAIGAIAFAHDGRSLLYSANRDGRTAVWRVAVDGSDEGAPTKLYESTHGISGLAVMPDGKRVVVAETDQDLNLWGVRSSGPAQPRLLVGSTRADALPRYSPDGSRVAFVSDRSGDSELWAVDSAGGNPVRLTELGFVRGVPAWSPDGKTIAVERANGDRSELWVVDAARRSATRVNTGLRDAMAPSWSADGRSIDVSSRIGGRWEVFRVELGSNSARQLTRNGGMAARAAPDGRAVLFVKPYTAGLWRLDLSTGTESLFVAEIGAGDCTNWDVSRGAVYFVRRGGDGRQSILRSSLDGRGVTTVVPNVTVPVGSGGITVSADGQWMVYAQTDRRDGDLVTITVSR